MVRIVRAGYQMRQTILKRIKTFIREYRQNRFQDAFPLKDFSEGLTKIRFVDPLTDSDMVELNNLLPWSCFVVDAYGRRFGKPAWTGKRCDPQIIPDPRIVLLHEHFDLADKHVLEVGCFEGIHTVGLSMLARKVTAIDARIENVVKTIVRSAMFGFTPTVFKHNLEESPIAPEVPSADVMLHMGVLYHLRDPVTHLLGLGRFVRLGLLLDTHYCLESEASETYEVMDKSYRYRACKEHGRRDVFSGMYDHSKWLTLEDMRGLLVQSGFSDVTIVETRQERNGPRALILAKRS